MYYSYYLIGSMGFTSSSNEDSLRLFRFVVDGTY